MWGCPALGTGMGGARVASPGFQPCFGLLGSHLLDLYSLACSFWGTLAMSRNMWAALGIEVASSRSMLAHTQGGPCSFPPQVPLQRIWKGCEQEQGCMQRVCRAHVHANVGTCMNACPHTHLCWSKGLPHPTPPSYPMGGEEATV